ncbi:hypothetical protein J6590_011451 [Homalodisca vitripennis]|nr:hypothetical protein J6590_011451 [Homalodisca vitripennis]
MIVVIFAPIAVKDSGKGLPKKICSGEGWVGRGTQPRDGTGVSEKEGKEATILATESIRLRHGKRLSTRLWGLWYAKTVSSTRPLDLHCVASLS